MLDRFRRFGPVIMVPAAWITAGLAISTSLISSNALLIAHLVMSVLMAAFLATGWRKMDSGVLKAWRTVIAAGLIITLMGTAGLLGQDIPALLSVSLHGWMLLPAAGLIYTGWKDQKFSKIYIASGLASLVGFIVFVLQIFYPFQSGLYAVSGLTLVGLGQTVGILVAAVQNS